MELIRWQRVYSLHLQKRRPSKNNPQYSVATIFILKNTSLSRTLEFLQYKWFSNSLLTWKSEWDIKHFSLYSPDDFDISKLVCEELIPPMNVGVLHSTPLTFHRLASYPSGISGNEVYSKKLRNNRRIFWSTTERYHVDFRNWSWLWCFFAWTFDHMSITTKTVGNPRKKNIRCNRKAKFICREQFAFK